jgi:GTPase SAR1 family protein
MPQQHISQLPRLGSLVSSLDGHQRVNLHCRVVVLGAAKVGKTAIVEQFLYDAFPVLHSATVEQLYRAEYQVRGAGLLLIKLYIISKIYSNFIQNVIKFKTL